jgi:4-hydroxybenzoate polyprenyltransferase
MLLAGAFLRLIRFPNLVFIALTQFLFYACIILPLSRSQPHTDLYLTWPLLGCLILASVFIAAAGYIINDYFDLNIDRINKPGKLVIDRQIRRRWAIVWHLVLSVIGLALSFYVDGLIGLFNIAAVLLLWFYSTTFKKQLLIGNLIISLLTAWVVLVLYVAELSYLIRHVNDPEHAEMVRKLFKYAVMYGGFAFIISLVREVVKDIEDREGDARYGCRTMPIAWGVPAARIFALVWLIVLFGSVAVLNAYALQLGWWVFVLYTSLAVLIPSTLVFSRIRKAKSTQDWSDTSAWVKGIMLAGILSMLFFKWYNG